MLEIENFSTGIMLTTNKPVVAVCCLCNRVRDVNGNWRKIAIPDSVMITHTYCNECMQVLLSGLKLR
ncbi:MAG: hypothetical protein ACE5PV_15790 [Candidatus Poribacteria bacterium]